jgi:hypothetical protein
MSIDPLYYRKVEILHLMSSTEYAISDFQKTRTITQTLARILKQMSQFLDWCVGEGELRANPWAALRVKDRPKGIRSAVASVLAVMPEDGEVIVVDDASDLPAMLALRRSPIPA